MGEPSRNARRRYRRARRRLRSQRGVVAVIGTLLALLVFFTLFGVFVTQYLPLWMTENESAFTAQADLAFAQFKSAVDSQYQLGGPQSVGVPFQLSSGSVPLLAQPTEGILEFLPSGCANGFNTTTGIRGQPAYAVSGGKPVYSPNTGPAACEFVNITLQEGPGGSGFFSQRIPTGVLQMLLPNRYYTPETYFFEDDAVIDWQPGGYEAMAVNPPLNVSHNAAGNTTISSTLLQLYGNASSIVGLGSQDLYSTYRYSQPVASNGLYVAANKSYLPFTFTFEIGTQYPCAWWSFLTQTMQFSGLASADWSLKQLAPGTNLTSTTAPSLAVCSNPAGLTSILTLNVANVNYAQYYYAGVEVSASLGGA